MVGGNMNEITLPIKLVLDIVQYLGTRPVKEVNILYNSLVMEIDKAQKAQAEKVKQPEVKEE
jgi:hypothetical protein